jgi:hypothetical protein
MERGTTTDRLRAAAALAVAAAGLSCGSGIKTIDSQVILSQVVDSKGGLLVLREARLDVCAGCVLASSTIVMRRYETIEHTGAIGPVFEIEVPDPKTFERDPQINIATSADVIGLRGAKIGFLIPNATPEQWFPESHTTELLCQSGFVCGPVQRETFTNPDGDPTNPTRFLQLAIIQPCGGTSECPYNQACYSGACQQCIDYSECNL